MILFLSMFLSLSMAQEYASSLTLREAVDRSVATYPTIKKAIDDIDIAEINKKIQQDVYLPSIAGSASYLWLDPISKLTMNGRTISIQSHNNASFGVSISQLIWDFGKSAPKIEAAKIKRELAILEKNQLIQNLSLQTIESYLMTAYAKYSINVKERQLSDYAVLLKMTEIRRNTGSATNFDYLNTNSGYNAIKTELITLNTVKEKQYVSLSLLTDTLINDNTNLSLSFDNPKENQNLDELITYAMDNRIEMNIIRKQYDLAVEERKAGDRILNPTLSVSASAGAKNGYEPSIEDIRFNYSAGATLNIPIYEGSKRARQRSLGKLDVNKALNAIDIAKKEITSQVADSYLSLISSFAKIEQLKIQKEVSDKAYEQAKVNYESGAITNLELLTASTNAVNSELYLIQEQISHRISYFKLMIDIGVNIDTIINSEHNDIY